MRPTVFRSLSPFALAFVALPAQANLLTNGGFETGDFTGWVVFGGPNTGVDADSAHTGDFGAFSGPSGRSNSLVQFVDTTPGVRYTVSFWLRNDSGEPTSSFRAFFGRDILTIQSNPAAFEYQQYRFTVTAQDPFSALQFDFRHDDAYFHLDDVSVVATPGAVAALPFALMALRRRKRA